MRKMLVFGLLLLLLPLGAWATGQADEGGAVEGAVLDGSGPSYSWDTSPIEIDWYVHDPRDFADWNPEVNRIHRAITDATGVSINWRTNAGAQGNERLLTMMASDTLPDMYTIPSYMGEWRELQAAGKAYDLNQLLDMYADDFDEQIPDSMRNWYTAPDGAWYAWPSGYWAPELLSRWGAGITYDADVAMWARSDLMEDAGFTAKGMMTQDEVVAALQRVQDANLTYNGQDVYPLLLGSFNNGGGEFVVDNVLGSFFAIPREDRSGNLVSLWHQPKYLEALLFLNRLYREGLIPRENFSMSMDEIRELGNQGRVFSFIGPFWDYRWHMVMVPLDTDPEARNVAIGPILANDGATPLVNPTALTGDKVTMINEAFDRPDRAIRLLEFAFQHENLEVLQFGAEDETFVRTGDGRVVRQSNEYWTNWVAENPGWPAWAEVWFDQFYWQVYPGGWHQRFEAPRSDLKSVVAYQEVQQPFRDLTWDNRAFTNIDPEGGSEEAGINAQAETYWYAALVDIIMADSPAACEAAYREALDYVESIGYDRVISVMNAGFQENKDRLGLDLAWPEY